MRRWIGAVVLSAAMATLACDEDAGSTILVEDIDGSAVHPDDPEPEPEPRPEPDPDGLEDPETGDAGRDAEAAGGRDAAAPSEPDAALDAAPSPDAGFDDPAEPEPEPDAAPPDNSAPGDPEVDPDNVIPDGQLLDMPGCGLLDPGLALAVGPAAYMTYLHGSPAFRFDEPALAGCLPERLWAGVPGGFRQDITFAYRGERLLEWNWLLGTPDGGVAAPATVSYDGHGRVERATYRCPWGPGVEQHGFAYDRSGRLIQGRLERPARCRLDGDGALHRTTTWRYAEPGDALPASRTVEDVARGADGVDVQAAARATVEIEYAHDGVGRIVEVREFGADGRLDEWRSLTWGGDRVVRQVVRRRAANAHRNAELVATSQAYAYDRVGRLIARRDEATGDILVIGYGANGLESVETTNPEALRTMGYPEISAFDRIGLHDNPEAPVRR